MSLSSLQNMHVMPLMSGSHECEQTIGANGILERTECREKHTFRPFPSQKSGAATTTRQQLTFSSQSAGDSVRTGERKNKVASLFSSLFGGIDVSADSTRHTNLLFEHEDSTPEEQDVSEVMAILREICELEDIRPETPRLYSRLVYALRKLDDNGWKNLNSPFCDGRNSRKENMLRYDELVNVLHC